MSPIPGQKDCSISRVVHQLGHVVNDDSRLALDGSLPLTQASDQQGHHDGQGGSLHGLHKSGGRQLVDCLWHLCWVGHGRDEGRHKLLNVAVAHSSASLVHGLDGSSLQYAG